MISRERQCQPRDSLGCADRCDDDLFRWRTVGPPLVVLVQGQRYSQCTGSRPENETRAPLWRCRSFPSQPNEGQRCQHPAAASRARQLGAFSARGPSLRARAWCRCNRHILFLRAAREAGVWVVSCRLEAPVPATAAPKRRALQQVVPSSVAGPRAPWANTKTTSRRGPGRQRWAKCRSGQVPLTAEARRSSLLYPLEHFSPACPHQEDDLLRQLIKEYGPKNWSIIANGIKGRSGKSCRLRCDAGVEPPYSHLPAAASVASAPSRCWPCRRPSTEDGGPCLTRCCILSRLLPLCPRPAGGATSSTQR